MFAFSFLQRIAGWLVKCESDSKEDSIRGLPFCSYKISGGNLKPQCITGLRRSTQIISVRPEGGSQSKGMWIKEQKATSLWKPCGTFGRGHLPPLASTLCPSSHGLQKGPPPHQADSRLVSSFCRPTRQSLLLGLTFREWQRKFLGRCFLGSLFLGGPGIPIFFFPAKWNHQNPILLFSYFWRDLLASRPVQSSLQIAWGENQSRPCSPSPGMSYLSSPTK